MTKNEFMDFKNYVVELFGMKDITNKEILATWYKSFEKVSMVLAKEMAQRYFQEEKGRFNFSRLLEYKSICMRGKTWYEEAEKVDCILCNGTGYVQVEERRENHIYQVMYRCTCEKGDTIPHYIKQVDSDVLENHYEYCGVYKLAKPKDVPQDIPGAIKDCINRMGGRI